MNLLAIFLSDSFFSPDVAEDVIPLFHRRAQKQMGNIYSDDFNIPFDFKTKVALDFMKDPFCAVELLSAVCI